ncbi:MAG: hypothetical protein COT74_05605 [Bdellovibrionales bacterium CG10_big_fil_rev_8_21_14_0_10_45_34]|nr:MAG: hypothetical protein COT74_05605 [Bdellovibrionales bacterium CG10_big_fil_rev_8_21_14_0_10_45_34]
MKQFLCCLSIVICTGLAAQAQRGPLMGGERGNGGDVDEILIHSIATEIARYLQTAEGSQLIPEVNGADMQKLLDEVKVSVDEQDLENELGHSRTAINQPERQRVLVDRRRFTPYRLTGKVVVPLVAHEFFGLMGVEIEEYSLSSRLSAISDKILDSALSTQENIYYFSAEKLKRPIALFRTSIVLDEKGKLKRGIFARPTRIISDQIGIVVEQGSCFYVSLNLIHLCGTKEPYKVKIRYTEADSWKEATLLFRSSSISFFRDFTLSSVYIRAGSAFSFGNISGQIQMITQGEKGNLLTVSCYSYLERDFGKCETTLQSQKIYFSFLKFHSRRLLERLESFDDQAVRLRVPQITPQMNFNSKQAILFDLNGNVVKGQLWGTANIRVEGRLYSIKKASFDYNGRVHFSSNKEMPTSYSGAPIVASEASASAYCRSIDHDLAESSSRIVHFTGEMTFYDYTREEFVTHSRGSQEVFDKLICKKDLVGNSADIIQ